jgi:hypothetical protein
MHAPEEVRPQEEPQGKATNTPPIEKKPRLEVVHDETPPRKRDHPFEPRGEWWSLCRHCNLSEAAHSETTLTGRQHIRYYSDDNPEE